MLILFHSALQPCHLNKYRDCAECLVKTTSAQVWMRNPQAINMNVHFTISLQRRNGNVCP